MRVAVLALAVLAFFGAVANGEHLYEDLPGSLVQQRSLLQGTTSTPVYGARVKASGTISLLIRPLSPAPAPFDSRKYGLAYFNARIKPILRKYNAAYRTAHLNFRATYVSGPVSLALGKQGWLTYSFVVDLGPAGSSYSAALRGEIRSKLRSRAAYVLRVRGNIP